MKSLGKKHRTIIIFSTLIFVVITSLYIFLNTFLFKEDSNYNTGLDDPNHVNEKWVTMPQQKTNIPSDWEIYKNKTFKYSFAYPPNWKIDINDAEPNSNRTNPMSSYIMLTTPEGYLLTFNYNAGYMGYTGLTFIKYANVSIDGKRFTKAYINRCVAYKPPPGCEKVFYAIVYDPSVNFSKNLAHYIFSLNHKTTVLSFYLSKYWGGQPIKELPLNDPSFKKTDDMLDRVIASFELPTK